MMLFMEVQSDMMNWIESHRIESNELLEWTTSRAGEYVTVSTSWIILQPLKSIDSILLEDHYMNN